MTLASTIPVEQTIADGVAVTFSYGFLIDAASDILILQGAAIASPGTFSLTGVGNAAGGTFTFTAAPPIGTVISRFRVVDFGQATSYTEGDAFLEQNHEGSVDALAQQITQLAETFQRIPVFPRNVNGTIRGMALPLPEALKLLQWNSTADGLTNADSSILTVSPLPGAGARTEAQATVAVSPTGGELVLTAAALVPAGALLKAVLTHNSVAPGTSNGLSGYSVGTIVAPERYGRGVSIALLGANNAGQFRNYVEEPAASALAVILQAEGGAFDAVGTVIVTAVFDLYTNPTSVP